MYSTYCYRHREMVALHINCQGLRQGHVMGSHDRMGYVYTYMCRWCVWMGCECGWTQGAFLWPIHELISLTMNSLYTQCIQYMCSYMYMGIPV